MTESRPLHVGHLIRLAQQIHARMWAKDVSSDVTSPQLQVLSVLESHPNIDQAAAARLAGLDRSTGGELIERLLRSGHLERRRDQRDRRRYKLTITSRGAQLLQELRPLSQQLHERMLAMVPEELRRQFFDGLRSFVENGSDGELLTTRLVDQSPGIASD